MLIFTRLFMLSLLSQSWSWPEATSWSWPEDISLLMLRKKNRQFHNQASICTANIWLVKGTDQQWHTNSQVISKCIVCSNIHIDNIYRASQEKTAYHHIYPVSGIHSFDSLSIAQTLMIWAGKVRLNSWHVSHWVLQGTERLLWQNNNKLQWLKSTTSPITNS